MKVFATLELAKVCVGGKGEKIQNSNKKIKMLKVCCL